MEGRTRNTKHSWKWIAQNCISTFQRLPEGVFGAAGDGHSEAALSKSTSYSVLHILYYYFDASKNTTAKLYNLIWNYSLFCHRRRKKKKKKGRRDWCHWHVWEYMICFDSTLYLQSPSPGRLCWNEFGIKRHVARLTGNNSGTFLSSSTEMTEDPEHASKYISSEFN